MATFTYLTETELAKDHGVKHLDPAVQTALFNTLENDGVYSTAGEKAWFEKGNLHGAQPLPFIQILETTKTADITTDPALKAIIMNDHHGVGHELTVSGGANNQFIAMGTGPDTVKLLDAGNDTVYGGKGNDTIDASGSSGNDSLVGGSGNNTIYGGTGQDTLRGGTGSEDALHSGSNASGHNVLYAGSGSDTLYGGGGADSLYGGSGPDTLIAGTGQHQLLQAGSGNALLEDTMAGFGGTDTLVGGSGNDTIKGQQGDVLEDTGAAGSKNDFYLYAGGTGGNSTLQGGAGNDTFHIETNTGNDTIIGGGGHDVVDLDKQASTDLAGAPQLNSDGSFTLTFDNGQHITVNGITTVHFSDGMKFNP